MKIFNLPPPNWTFFSWETYWCEAKRFKNKDPRLISCDVKLFCLPAIRPLDGGKYKIQSANPPKLIRLRLIPGNNMMLLLFNIIICLREHTHSHHNFRLLWIMWIEKPFQIKVSEMLKIIKCDESMQILSLNIHFKIPVFYLFFTKFHDSITIMWLV